MSKIRKLENCENLFILNYNRANFQWNRRQKNSSLFHFSISLSTILFSYFSFSLFLFLFFVSFFLSLFFSFYLSFCPFSFSLDNLLGIMPVVRWEIRDIILLFLTSRIELRTKTKPNALCKRRRLISFFMLNSAFGRTLSLLQLHMSFSSLNCIFFFDLILLFINACFCQRPCWTPKAKPNAPFLRSVSFRFRCLTRL